MKRPQRTHTAKPIALPSHWSDKQAAAVYEILDELLDCLWRQYGSQIHHVMRRSQIRARPIDMGEAGEPF